MIDPQAVDSLLSVGLRSAAQEGTTAGWRLFIDGWEGFAEWRVLLRVVTSLAVAIALALALAFHPRRASRSGTVAEIEAPKTLVLYAVIGTIVARVVVVEPVMALVVFGIGGLLRFRTDIGAPGDTGLVILVTIVGIASGLNLFPLAVIGTAVGWGVLYFMERAYRVLLRVQDLPETSFEAAVEAHVAAVSGAGVRVLNLRERRDRRRIYLTLHLSADVSSRDVDARLESVDPSLRGSWDWEAPEG